MFVDRSTRNVLAVILTTAAVVIGINLWINPDGLADNMQLFFFVLLGLSAILWAWNWRADYAAAHPEEEIDEEDYEPVLPYVAAPALQPELSAPAVTLTDAAELAAAPVDIMPVTPEPVILPVPDPVTPPAPLVPEPVAPPAPEPVAPPAPEPAAPPVPEPVTPPVIVPVEPELPTPVEVPPAEPVETAPEAAAVTALPEAEIIPPAEVEAPQPGPTPGLTDLVSAEQKDSAPEPIAPETVEDARDGEPVAEKVVADAMAAPEQPDASQASAAEFASDEPAVAAETAAAVVSEADDFTRIEGIGNYYRDALHKIGYETFAQLAAAEPEVILQKLLDAGFRRHPTISTWPEQSGFAARGDWDGLKVLQDTLVAGRRV